MSPRTGRPPKGKTSRNINLNIRVTKAEADLIQGCAEKLSNMYRQGMLDCVWLLKSLKVLA